MLLVLLARLLLLALIVYLLIYVLRTVRNMLKGTRAKPVTPPSIFARKEQCPACQASFRTIQTEFACPSCRTVLTRTEDGGWRVKIN